MSIPSRLPMPVLATTGLNAPVSKSTLKIEALLPQLTTNARLFASSMTTPVRSRSGRRDQYFTRHSAGVGYVNAMQLAR